VKSRLFTGDFCEVISTLIVRETSNHDGHGSNIAAS
jgi:hypothetical protein